MVFDGICTFGSAMFWLYIEAVLLQNHTGSRSRLVQTGMPIWRALIDGDAPSSIDFLPLL